MGHSPQEAEIFRITSRNAWWKQKIFPTHKHAAKRKNFMHNKNIFINRIFSTQPTIYV